jgi:hypothetical protein
MKKILSSIILLSLLNCANKSNTSIEEAFIAISVIESFVFQAKNDEFKTINNELCIEGSYTHIGENSLNGFLISSCEFNSTENLLVLKSSCSKFINPIISTNISINLPNTINGSLKFEGLLNIEKICNFTLEYSEENYTNLIDGRICGYEVSEIINANFSYDNPNNIICSYLN